jgi:hypothetical protein
MSYNHCCLVGKIESIDSRTFEPDALYITMKIDRQSKPVGEPKSDLIGIDFLGYQAVLADRNLSEGMIILIEGEIQALQSGLIRIVAHRFQIMNWKKEQ